MLNLEVLIFIIDNIDRKVNWVKQYEKMKKKIVVG